MLGTDARCSFRELSVLQVCLWRDLTVLPTNSSGCLLGERFKVKMGLPEWYTNDAVAQYLVQWVIFSFFIGVNWVSGTCSQFAVADPGKGPGEATPLIFKPNWGLKLAKKIFLQTGPPYLRVWITRPPLISRSGSGSGLINWKLFVLLLNTRQCICVHLDSNKDKYNLLV